VADLAVIQVGININRRKLFTNNISTYFEVVSWVLNLVKSILKSPAIMQGKRCMASLCKTASNLLLNSLIALFGCRYTPPIVYF